MTSVRSHAMEVLLAALIPGSAHTSSLALPYDEASPRRTNFMRGSIALAFVAELESLRSAQQYSAMISQQAAAKSR